jgi:hypothetical protein
MALIMLQIILIMANNKTISNTIIISQQQHLINNQYLTITTSICNPIPPEAGKTEKLILSLTEQRLGDPIRGYNVVHDKVMHLIIVREYLSHLHLKTMASS